MPTDTGLAAHNGGISGDTVQLFHCRDSLLQCGYVAILADIPVGVRPYRRAWGILMQGVCVRRENIFTWVDTAGVTYLCSLAVDFRQGQGYSAVAILRDGKGKGMRFALESPDLLSPHKGEQMVHKKTIVVSAPETDESVPQEAITKRNRTLVFISHDSRDADFAEAFANLLSDVSAGTLKSFSSSDKKGNYGIAFGTEWYKAIMSQLEDATDVVALLTRHSIDRPWILYEAGVAKGKLNTNVLGVALGVPLEKVSTGPFGQFQNCGDDEDSLTKLVIQLLKRNPDASPREEAVRVQVRVFLEGVKKLLSAKGKPTTPVETDETSIAKLFEEVKVMVRELPERVDDRVRSVAKRGSLKRMRRIHPMMFEELLFHPALNKTRHGPAVAWLLFLSVFKEEMPWIYEIGLELYHALRSGNSKSIADARKELISILEAVTHGPFFHEMMRDENEEMYFMARHLPEMVDRFIEHLPLRLKLRSRPKITESATSNED